MTSQQHLRTPWLASPALTQVFAALGTGSARLVGGCVRDGLLGQHVSDIDIACVHPPEETRALAQAAGLKAIPTGIEHGTITVVADGTAFEVTTLREDVETDGRRAKVAFSDDWQADAARRDFTINALYAQADGTLHDYFGGQADLAAGKVRFIGSPVDRIKEDGLRILRFYRFSARYSDGLDLDGRAACKHWTGALKSLSRERIQTEWLKLLSAIDPVSTVNAMHEDGALQAFLPEARPSQLAALISLEARYDLPAEAFRRFAALLPASADQSEKIARRLKCSNRQRERLIKLAVRLDAASDPHSVVYEHGAERAMDLAVLSDLPDDLRGVVIETARTWQPPVFPLRGQDLLNKTQLRGAQIGRALFQLEQRWIESGFTLTQEELMAAAPTV